ncbi:MAG: SpoIIIAH-like family protein [Clostridia bacterium]|nr:SpoIIIAH-like family protein [Clostridia bacterium]
MKFGKRELIMSVLVVSLGAAVYLNWQFGANSDKLAVKSEDDDLGVAHYVNASISTADTAPKKTQSKPQEDTVSKLSETEEYFANVRLERKQTQDELIELARSVVEASETSTKGKEDAVKQLNKLSNIIQQQSNIENLIKAKGFDDCIAFIQNGECSIVVTGKELKSDLLLAIKDIVIGQSGIEFDKIRVTQI